MSTVRVRMRGRGARVGRRPRRTDLPRLLLLLGCAVIAFAVFAAFYALGSVTRSTPAVPRAYGLQVLPAVSVRAGIPETLIAAPAIPPPVASAVTPEASARARSGGNSGSPRSGTATGGSSGRSAAEGSGSSAPSSAREGSGASAPSSAVRSEGPAPAPAQAPQPASQSHGGSSSGEGTTFDSSG